MSRWLVLPLLLLLPCVASAASGAARRDRDHDRLPDRWEKRYHLSIVKKSAKRDPDHDGLRNLREYRLRTHPRRRDTDGDGLRDGAEVRRYRTNPRRKDTDGDGYSDRVEVRAGTSPRAGESHPSGSPAPPAPIPAPRSTGFPDASNTGVPAGTALTASGSLTVTQAGAVIDGRDISGPVIVNAPNVTIRRSVIRTNAFRAIENNSTGLVVEDSEIRNRPVSSQNNCHNGIGWGNYTLRRVEVTGCENAADVGGNNVVVEDSYFHDLDTQGPSWVWGCCPHSDGVQGIGSNVTIRHNWIDPTPGSGANSGITMAGGAIQNYRVEDNYIDGRGSSWAIYAPRVQTSGVVIKGNRLLRGNNPTYTACVRVGITVAEFTDNRDAITDALLPPDDGASGGCVY